MTISINMKFWNDGKENSTRKRNVEFAWSELKKLHSFLLKRGVECEISLYDFSPERITEESIHIPYPMSVFKKAEKTNVILNQKLDFDFFMMIDSDAFFQEEDYEKFYMLISELNYGDIITFDLAKLYENIEHYIVDGQFRLEFADWSFAYSGKRENGPLHQSLGGLGGVYICDRKLLSDLGGFDVSYEAWGGEDGDMLSRIMTSGKKYQLKPTKHFFPFHLPHFYDWGNKLFFNR